jgi:hypothetical protein
MEVVQATYQGLLQSDRDALQLLISPEIKIRVTKELAYGGDYSGIAGFQALFKNTFERIKSTIEIEQFFNAGSQVVAIGRTRGVGQASGISFDSALVHVWTITDGKIIRFDAFVEDGPITTAIDGTQNA